jgi:putative sigma-54 modulation protein
MRIEIVGHQIEVTPALKEAVLGKLSKLERHSEDLIDGRVTLSVERLLKKVDATINLSGHSIHAEASDADMYTAIDQLLDKLHRQIIKRKEKPMRHHRPEQSIRTAEAG